ncbi:MAG: class I SAM-dependent methyltransferase [Sulfobacillus sp.]
MGDHYPNNYWEQCDDGFEADSGYTDALRHLIESGRGQGKAVLDIGCGTGRFLAVAQRKGWEVWGVEPGPPAARVAAATVGPTCIHQGDVFDWQPHRSFDLVTLLDVLEHVHDPLRLLQKCHELIKPGGHLLVRSPNFACWERRIFGQHWLGLQVPTHLTHFTVHHMAIAARKVGFRAVHIEGVRVSFFYDSLDQAIHKRRCAARRSQPHAASGSAGEQSDPEMVPEHSPQKLERQDRLNGKGRFLYRGLSLAARVQPHLAHLHHLFPGTGPIFSALLAR